MDHLSSIAQLEERVRIANEQKKRTPLHMAVLEGRLEAVKSLLEEGACVNVADSNGETPLFAAVKIGFEEFIELLLDNKADVNAQTLDGVTPLHEATFLCDYRRIDGLEIVQLLLESGARVNLKDNFGWSPLHEALESNLIRCSKLLIDYGADVNARLQDNRTPLHIAASVLGLRNVKILLKHGCDINATSKCGGTPFTEVLEHTDMVYNRILSVKYDRAEYILIAKIINLFKFHIVALKAAGLYVNEWNLRNMNRDTSDFEETYMRYIKYEKFVSEQDLEEHEFECKKELKMLRSKLNVSIYDILNTKNPRYTLNKTFKQNLKSLHVNGIRFYGYMIKVKYLKDREKAELFEESGNSIRKLMEKDDRIQHLVISYELLDKILCHLSKSDLQNLIRSAGSL